MYVKLWVIAVACLVILLIDLAIQKCCPGGEWRGSLRECLSDPQGVELRMNDAAHDPNAGVPAAAAAGVDLHALGPVGILHGYNPLDYVRGFRDADELAAVLLPGGTAEELGQLSFAILACVNAVDAPDGKNLFTLARQFSKVVPP